MTREDAIKVLNMVEAHGLADEAKRMAIKALEQEPCEDAISRQAVLDINESHHGQMPNHINHQIWQEIKELPPVNPQPKTGHWIDADGDNAICGCCNRLNHLYGTYCKHCGAKMESEEQA